MRILRQGGASNFLAFPEDNQVVELSEVLWKPLDTGIAFGQGMPAVLDSVISSSDEGSGNLGPLIPQRIMHLKNDAIFLR